jgi:hypothetical protein
MGEEKERELEGVAPALRVPALLFHRHLLGFHQAL